jgi:signal transduction histidine kinase
MLTLRIRSIPSLAVKVLMANNCTVLIVDDSAADRRIYRRFLTKSEDPHEFYDILEADSGEQGLALCQEGSCQILLLDFYLPDMDGLEFLQRLKHQSHWTMPVIMMTGQSDTAVAVQAMKWGVLDYLDKRHVTKDVLRLLLRNALQKSQLSARLIQTQERQQLIATTALRIRESLKLQDILQTAVNELQQLLKCDRVVVYQCAIGQSSPIMAQAIDPATESQSNTSLDWTQEVTLVCAAGGLTGGDSKISQPHTSHDQLIPITLVQGDAGETPPWGMLVAHHGDRTRPWQPDEVELLQEVSVHLAIAIQQAELLGQTQAALEKEKQLNAFKSQFVTTVSHEYRTPLAAILGAASTLKQHSRRLEQARQQRLLDIIEERAKLMTKLVSDVLMVNQIELNKARFQPMPLNLPLFFSELMAEQRILGGDRFQLSFEVSGDTQHFCGDRGLLRLIFDNLLSNAIKYSPNGGLIEFTLVGEPASIKIVVQDQGIGILEEDQQHLFESFKRGGNVDTIPGTGLGLAIVKACVELHQGHIQLKSSPGAGTKVIIRLPNQLSLTVPPDLSTTEELISRATSPSP